MNHGKHGKHRKHVHGQNSTNSRELSWQFDCFTKLLRGLRTFQLGIVSFSIPCAVKGMPSIYTNVIYFMDWLKKNMI